MSPILKRVIWLGLVSLSACTDLAAVYQNSIIILRDADKINPESPLLWKPLVIPLTRKLTVPIGLTYDPDGKRLFVTNHEIGSKQIYSISLSSDYVVEAMQPVVKTGNDTSILENLIYDPRSRQLFWADSNTHGIYKAQISSELEGDNLAEIVPVHNFDVYKPRGIALDYCNEQLYWSERGEITTSSVEKSNFDSSEHQVILNATDFKYQALTYDITKDTLIWAETGKSENKKGCSIVRGLEEHQILVNLDDCQPFSLIKDEEFIYWADFFQEGIMRASLTNPDSIVKLVHTPKTNVHISVYGLTLLTGPTKDSILNICEEKTDFMNKINMNDHELEVRNMTKEPSEVVVPIDGIVENNEQSSDSTVTSKSTTEEDRELVSVPIRNSSRLLVVGSETEAPPCTPSVASDNLKKVAKPEISNCNTDWLLLIITVLAVVCTLLMSSTIFLLVKLSCQRKTGECKTALPIIAASKEASFSRAVRQVKRFGHKRRYGSGNKSGFNGTSPCSGLSDDGVSINIEDCCQMTMCETPCYTSLKREGKGYKSGNKINGKHEDIRGLLDDLEDI